MRILVGRKGTRNFGPPSWTRVVKRRDDTSWKSRLDLVDALIVSTGGPTTVHLLFRAYFNFSLPFATTTAETVICDENGLWTSCVNPWRRFEKPATKTLGLFYRVAFYGGRLFTVQMLPFEIREQLNLTLARPYLTFKASAQTWLHFWHFEYRCIYPTRIPLQIPVLQTYLPRAYLVCHCLVALAWKQCKITRICSFLLLGRHRARFIYNEGFATIRSNRANASQDPTMIQRNAVNTDGGKRSGKEYLCRISIDRFTVQPLITVQTTSYYFPNSKRRG